MKPTAIGIAVVGVALALGAWLFGSTQKSISADKNVSSAPATADAQTTRAQPVQAANVPTKPAFWPCQPAVGEELAWRFKQTTTATIAAGALLGLEAAEETSEQQIEGLLRATVHPYGDGAVALAMQWHELHIDIAGADAEDELRIQWSKPATVVIAADCRAQKLAVGAGVGSQARNQWRLLWSLLNVRRANAGRSWLTRQETATGLVRTTYRDAGDGTAALVRQRTRYLSTHGPSTNQQLVAKVLGSMVRVTALPKRGVTAWQGREDVRLVTQSGRRFAQSRTEFEAVAVAMTEVPEVARKKVPLVRAVTWFGLGPLESTGKDPEFDPPKVASKTWTAARQAFVAAAKAGQRRQALGVLVTFLRAHPHAAAEVARWIRSGRDKQHHALIFEALELTGTAQSTETLVDLLRDENLPTTDRSRAAAALQDVPVVSDEVVAAVLDVAGGVETSDGAAADALLAVGTLAGRKDVSPKKQAKLRARLLAGLGASEADAGALALAAIGNTADPGLAQEVMLSLDAPSAARRAAAAAALLKLGVNLPANDTLARLEVSEDARVSRALGRHVAGAQGWKPSDAKAIAALLLSAGLPVTTKVALAAVLSKLAALDPQAKAVWESAVSAAKSAEIVRALGSGAAAGTSTK